MFEGPQLPQRMKQLENQVTQLRKASKSTKNQANGLRGAVRAFKSNKFISSAASGNVISAANTEPTTMAEKNYCSPYLRSLLVPEDGATSVPDDVMRLHSIRTETVTYNLAMVNPDASTGPVSGVLILYPNHPTNLIGYNFIYNPTTSNYVYNTSLLTAQNLSVNYDYARRTSQILTIKSSTLPSGMYAINGTMNAVRVDGTVSELSLTPATLYSQILADTTNLYDKIGNVSVGDGLAVLSIPDSFINPYTRLGDTSPLTLNIGNSIANTIIDSGQDLTYHFLGNSNSVSVGTSAVTLFSITSNVDSTTGVMLNLTYLPIITSISTAVTCNLITEITYYDPFGNEIFQQEDTQGISLANVLSSTSDNVITINIFANPIRFGGNASSGPIAGFNFLVAAVCNAGTANVALQNVDLKLVVPTGARPGLNQPVVVVPYQSVANDSVLTLTGISNFELIPNPDLRQNLETTYGHFDPEELEYVKTIVMNREKYNIRSVFNAKEYDQLKPAFRELADCKVHSATSEALGWGDIARFVKKKVFPALQLGAQAVLPQFAPFVNGITNGIGSLISDSASGRVRQYAGQRTIRAYLLDALREHHKAHWEDEFEKGTLNPYHHELVHERFETNKFYAQLDIVSKAFQYELTRDKMDPILVKFLSQYYVYLCDEPLILDFDDAQTLSSFAAGSLRDVMIAKLYEVYPEYYQYVAFNEFWPKVLSEEFDQLWAYEKWNLLTRCMEDIYEQNYVALGEETRQIGVIGYWEVDTPLMKMLLKLRASISATIDDIVNCGVSEMNSLALGCSTSLEAKKAVDSQGMIKTALDMLFRGPHVLQDCEDIFVKIENIVKKYKFSGFESIFDSLIHDENFQALTVVEKFDRLKQVLVRSSREYCIANREFTEEVNVLFRNANYQAAKSAESHIQWFVDRSIVNFIDVMQTQYLYQAKMLEEDQKRNTVYPQLLEELQEKVALKQSTPSVSTIRSYAMENDLEELVKSIQEEMKRKSGESDEELEMVGSVNPDTINFSHTLHSLKAVYKIFGSLTPTNV